MVTVYTAPGCHKCKKTMDFMTKNGVGFNTVDLTENEEKMVMFQNKNLRELPIVTDENDEVLWNGGIQIHRVLEIA